MSPIVFPRDLIKFLSWVFFKPITLENYLKQLNPDFKRETSLITIWRRGGDKTDVRHFLGLVFFHIFITPWLVTFAIAGLFALVGFDVNWLDVGLGTAIGVVLGVGLGMAISAVLGMGLGIAVGMGLGIAVGMGLGMAVSVVLGVGVGMAFGVFSMAFRARLGEAFGLAVGLMLGMVASVRGDGVVGLIFRISFWIGYFRIANYLIEAPFSFLLSRFSKRSTLHPSPVIWDEMIWLPLIGLDKQLVSIGKANRKEGMKAIAYVAGSFRQNWAAQRALLELTAFDVQTSKKLESIASISETLSWLPPETRATYKSLLLGLETVSKHAKASIESDTLYNRQEQLRLALNETQSMRQGFAYETNQQIPRLMSPALEVWESLLADELAKVQQQEAIPNVYVAGRPLDTKSKVFRGRRDVFKFLEQELISPAEQRPAILLFGARRTGKTSVLRQLPETLGPQVIPVVVDLQGAALEKDAAGLLYNITEKIRSDALLFRHLEFNELPHAALDANPYSAFSEWLQKLQKTIGERWIFLNLDEYEYLEKMLYDKRVDERLFQLLRTLLQNHPRLTLLLSGLHTFEDLNPIWSHHLINARVVKINPLREEEARELITKPIPDYPLVYTENAVKDILEATACQPYLIQAVCRDLVNMKNERHHFHADSKDVAKALESVLVSATAYFQDLWEGPDTDKAQQAIMGAIARAKNGTLSLNEINAVLKNAGFDQIPKVRQRALRMLEHRDILTSTKAGWSFQIPLMRRWIRVKQLGLKK